jgi:predicted nucleic acid-binding Zn ribbon protein
VKRKAPGGSTGPPRAFLARSAADAIASALRLHGITDEIRAQRLLTDWVELVGPKIASRTRPDGITDRVLWVEVATSAWLHELNMLRPQLLAGLHERFGPPVVFDELRFKLAGRDRRNATILRAARPAAPLRPVPPPATGAAREKIVRETAAVDDVELRELIARVRIANDK